MSGIGTICRHTTVKSIHFLSGGLKNDRQWDKRKYGHFRRRDVPKVVLTSPSPTAIGVANESMYRYELKEILC